MPFAVRADATGDPSTERAAGGRADSQNIADLGEIIVTAQRRHERLQDVPISISALTSDGLSDRGISDISGLVGNVPGLTITGFAAANSTNLLAIRGVAGQPLAIGASQATAVYIDGVYLSKPDAGFFALDDVERIEVLRGPQGTLYGRNATAGAINIITRAPGDTLQGGFDVSYGNYDSYAARGSVTGPIGRGFSYGLSGSATGRDGYYVNTVTGNRVGDASSYTGRMKLRYANDSGLDATLAADYSEVEHDDLFRNSLTGTSYAGLGNPKYVTTNIENDIGTKVRTGGVVITADYEVSPNISLTSITSWRRFRFWTVYDYDASTATLLHAFSTNENRTFNQELRVVYTGDRLRATVGANYYQESGEFYLANLGPGVPPTWETIKANPIPYNQTDLDVSAAFGQFEYDVTDLVTLIAGLRFNYEKRNFVTDYPGLDPAPRPVIGSLSDTALLPSFGANFKLAPDVLLYAKASKGYQAPGFNYLPGPGAPTNTFGPEDLWAFEAGIKSQLLDGLLTLNAAAFFYDYENLQVRTVTSATSARVLNSATAEVKGAEAEITLRPLTGVAVDAHVTYAKSVYTDFCEGTAATSPANNDPPCATPTGVPGADRRGNYLNLSPLWSGGVGVTYNAPLTDSHTLVLNANYSWATRSYFTPPNELAVSTQDWGQLNLRAAVQFANGLEIYAYGRNLSDQRHINFASHLALTLVATGLNDPRTYGAGVRYQF